MYCLALNVLKGELCLESGANCAAIYEKMQVIIIVITAVVQRYLLVKSVLFSA